MSQETAAAADPSSSEAVEELLRQLVDARFVLTDRDGSVTRWSRPAEVLFGWPAEAMVGRPLVETLGLPDNLPESGGQLTAMVRRQDGEELEVAMGLVPVRMSHSLEFNGFLEALEIVVPRGDALSELGRSHRTVVDWIQAALNGEAELDDDGLAAGTIIAFRPLHEPPPEPTLEELELAAAEAELEEAARAAERLAGLESELADTRQALNETRAQLEGLHGDIEHTLSARDEQARADAERLERDLDEKLKAIEAAHARDDDLTVRIDEVHGKLAGFESALAETRDQVHTKLEALERAAGERENAGDEEARLLINELREELTQLQARAARAHDSAEATVAAIGTEAARSQELVKAMLLELDQRAGDLRKWLAETDTSAGRAESAAAAAETGAARMAEAAEAAERRAAEAHEAATSAAEAAELARRSAAEAGAEAEAVRRAAYGAAQARAFGTPARLTPLDGRERPAAANGKPGSRHHRPLFAKRTHQPQRDPRPGFDDAANPMATIELNGHFRELNRAFCDLVGHSEEEFRAAVWPPVTDRANLPKHREQMKQLLDGDIDSAAFDTSYVHAQGLLVPVAGGITLVERDGSADHFLLDVTAPNAGR